MSFTHTHGAMHILKSMSKIIGVESGVLAETVQGKLVIKNAAVVLRSGNVFRSGQKLEFEVGSSIGLPTKWVVYLSKSKRSDDWIGCYFKKLEYPQGCKEIIVSYNINIKKVNDSGLNLQRQASNKNVVNVSHWGFPNVINRTSNVDELPLVDGTLTIDFEFKLFSNNTVGLNKRSNCDAPPTKIRKMNPPVKEMKSGVLVETARGSWKISNFDIVRQSDDLILSQKFEFNTSSEDGLNTTKCAVYLDPDVKDWIACFFQVLESPEDCKEINFSFSIKINKRDGKQFYFEESPVERQNISAGWGYRKVISRTAKVDELPLVNGTLTILFEFKIYKSENPMPEKVIEKKKLEAYELAFLKQLSKDWDKCRNLDLPNGDDVMKILSSDGEEFKVSTRILSARSVAFQRMFQTPMKESESGIVRLDDVSSKVLTVLLEYIVAAKLHKDWKDEDVIEELVYAAHKYELDLFVKFLDDILIDICTKVNVKRLALLAQRMDLKKAKVDLFHLIKRDASTLEDLTLIPRQ